MGGKGTAIKESLTFLIQRIVFMRNRPLVSKLFVFSAVLVVIPMVIIGYISYHRSSQVLENEARQYSLQIIEQVQANIEYYVQDFEIDTMKVMYNPQMVAFLKMQSQEEIDQSGIRKSLREMLQNAAYSRADISSITVILDNLQVVDTSESSGLYPATELRNEYWYSNAPFNGEPIVISRFVPWEMGEEPVISIAKRLLSPYTLKPVGMLITDVNYKRIQDIADKVLIGRTGHMYIIDSHGHYVYHPDLKEIGKNAPFNEKILNSSNGSFVSDNGKNFITFSKSDQLGWVLVTSVPYKELTHNSGYIGWTIMITVLITLATAYLLGFGFAASIVTPIKRLQHVVRRAETGDFSGRVRVDSQDEIGLLSHGFNKMAERLTLMLEEIYFSKLRQTEMELRNRETELKALQSQMNPHFLYNSLETIRGMALDNDMDDIATMASSLAGLLRYNLKNDEHTVTLEQELELCSVYLRIQKFRFEEKLEYKIDVSDWALQQTIAKFSLQPLVENCIVHAMELGTRQVIITITAERGSDNAFQVTVTDNGDGMTDNTLHRLRSDLLQKDVLSGGPHIGIVNVHKRIRYLYGEEFGITIRSKQRHGTSVSIRLPMQSESQLEAVTVGG